LSKIWAFIKTHFLTKKFLTFGIIGVVNTGIHLLVYSICYKYISILDEAILAFISNSIAFVSASVFSYFANAILTFKPKKKSTTQFTVVMGVYLTRLLISSLLTSGFNFISIEWLKFDYEAIPLLKLIPPFLASALLIPIAYFALDWVFKKTDKEID
jgi:putative flippase GtrA